MGMIFTGGMSLTGGLVASLSGGAPVTDPYWANVSLLMHFDGTSGQTVFTDSSSNPKTINNVSGLTQGAGNAQVDTTIVKFGTGSAIFPTFGQLQVVDSNNELVLGTGDFTIEAWFRLGPGGAEYTVVSTQRNTDYSVSGSWDITILADRSIRFYVNPSPGAGRAVVLESSAGVISSDTWYSVAVTRSSNTARLFLDGNIVDTELNYNKSLGVDTNMRIGAMFNNVTGAFGSNNIDELRITKGVARYTSNYTPATSAFPNS